jgi:hypothetical protein
LAAPQSASAVAQNTLDFEAGRFFERVDNGGTVDRAEFHRLWRAARTGEPLMPSVASSVPMASHHAPQPSELPLPNDVDAGTRFDRFDRHDSRTIAFRAPKLLKEYGFRFLVCFRLAAITTGTWQEASS